jgi:prevent-host-death family protein
MDMLTMTSLSAQTQFGTLIDSSQREPVAVTRRGRPIAVVVSYADYAARNKTIPFHVAKLIADTAPLRGLAAGHAMRTHLATLGTKAETAGLTENDVMQLLNDD